MVNYTFLATELLKCLCASADAKHQRSTEDFTHGEMRILSLLSDKGDGISPTDICELSSMTTPRISAAIASLTKKELVLRRTDERDKRRLRIYITDKGRALVDAKKKELTDSLADLLMHLGETDAKEYVRIMERIREDALCEKSTVL